MTKPEDKPPGRKLARTKRSKEVVYSAIVRFLPDALSDPKGPANQLKVYRSKRADVFRGSKLMWTSTFTKFETPVEADGTTVIRFWRGGKLLITLHRVDKRRRPAGKKKT